MALNVVTRGFGPSASIPLVVTRGYTAGAAAAVVAQPAVGGYDFLNPPERRERKRKRKKPEPVKLDGEARVIGPAPVPSEIVPFEAEAPPIEITGIDTEGIARNIAAAYQAMEDEIIAVILLTA